MMRPPMGLPIQMPRGGHMDGSYRFPPQGSVMLPGGPGGMARGPMQITLGPRGPVPGGQMVLSRMPGPPPHGGVHSQQSVIVMQQSQRPGVHPGTNGPPHIRQPIRPGTSGEFNTKTSAFFYYLIVLSLGVPVSSSSMTVMPGQHPSGYYPGQQTLNQGVCLFLCLTIFK
jgi:hypothetical protein